MRITSSLLLLIVACGHAAAPRPQLPAAYGEYRRVDDAFTFELPDSGGFLLNNMPLDTARLPGLLRQYAAARRPDLRVAFLVDNPKRPWSAVEYVLHQAQVAGVQLFDFERSGRRLDGFRV